MRYFSSSSQRQHQQQCEDVLVDEKSSFPGRPFSAWAVFDGHNGDRVARYLGSNLLPELERRLPATSLPDEYDHDRLIYSDYVRRAVLATFLQLSLDVQQQSLGAGCGSTATVVVQTGQLLTVANVGSARCVLDVGHTAFECTADHKLGGNEDEDERLDAAGACIARLKFDLSGPAAQGEVGCGPLRLWPGGLHMSRAIGDADCSPVVIPHPYIQQVWLPRSKASRLIIATGNVWDSFDTYQKAASALRDVSLPNAAGAMLQRALKRKQHRADKGDLSVMVVEFVPESCNAFSSQCRLDRLSRSSTCSSSSSQGFPSAANLFRKSAATARLPNISMDGMQVPQQQQQQQQQCRSKQRSTRPGITDVFGTFREAGTACKPASHMASPSLTPCPSGKSMHLEPSTHMQQQQQQQGHVSRGSLMQRLLLQLCHMSFVRAISSGSGNLQQQQQQQTPSGRSTPMLQQVSSFGSSYESSGTLNSSSSGDGISSSMCSPLSHASSSSNSVVSSWRLSSSWRNFTRSHKAAAAAQQVAAQQQPQQGGNPSFARILAKLDTFQVYCQGQYMPIDKQLAMLDATCNWPTTRPARSCGNRPTGAAGKHGELLATVCCDTAAKGCDGHLSADYQAAIKCQKHCW